MTIVKQFDDISDIHQEVESKLQKCIRVDLNEPVDQDDDNTESVEVEILKEVFGEYWDEMEGNVFFDWRDDTEVWLRY